MLNTREDYLAWLYGAEYPKPEPVQAYLNELGKAPSFDEFRDTLTYLFDISFEEGEYRYSRTYDAWTKEICSMFFEIDEALDKKTLRKLCLQTIEGIADPAPKKGVTVRTIEQFKNRETENVFNGVSLKMLIEKELDGDKQLKQLARHCCVAV